MRFQIPPEPGLAFILLLIAMLTKEPKVLQTSAICENTMQQNSMRPGLPRPALCPGLPYILERSPRFFSWFKRVERGRKGGEEREC